MLPPDSTARAVATISKLPITAAALALRALPLSLQLAVLCSLFPVLKDVLASPSRKPATEVLDDEQLRDAALREYERLSSIEPAERNKEIKLSIIKLEVFLSKFDNLKGEKKKKLRDAIARLLYPSGIDQELTDEQEAIKALREDFKRHKARQNLLPLNEKLAHKMNKWRGVRVEGMSASDFIKQHFESEISQGLRFSDLSVIDPDLRQAALSEAKARGSRQKRDIGELTGMDLTNSLVEDKREQLAAILDADPDDPDFHSYFSNVTNPHKLQGASPRRSDLSHVEALEASSRRTRRR